MNGGHCHDTANHYTCTCQHGYGGSICDRGLLLHYVHLPAFVFIYVLLLCFSDKKELKKNNRDQYASISTEQK